MGDLLRKFKRVHFWVICGLVSVLSVVFWFLAVGRLEDEKKKRVSAINTKFSTVDTIQRTSPIPNTSVSSEMDKLIAKRQKEILDAWSIKFEQQNSEETGILTWPEELGPEFLRKVAPIKPIEQVIHHPAQDKDFPFGRLNIGQRSDYRKYIFRELPRLAESIGAEWKAAGGQNAGPRGMEGGFRQGMPGAGGETLATQSVVEWSVEDQSQLMSNHFTWGRTMGGGGEGFGRGGPMMRTTSGSDEEPTTVEILYMQEDLWILRSIVRIIERTNGGAKSRFNAAVKKIESIKIGKAAILSAGRVSQVLTQDEQAQSQQSPTGMDGFGPEGGDYGRPPVDGGYGDMAGPEGGPMVATAPDPAEGRYVDNNYEALPAESLRALWANEGGDLDPEKAYLAVAKRVPVRFRISVDQRKLPSLLVECANAELTVEVRQVRVNPTDDPMAMGGMSGMQPGRMPQRGAEGYGGEGGRFGQRTDTAINPYPFDVTAEITASFISSTPSTSGRWALTNPKRKLIPPALPARR